MSVLVIGIEFLAFSIIGEALAKKMQMRRVKKEQASVPMTTREKVKSILAETEPEKKQEKEESTNTLDQPSVKTYTIFDTALDAIAKKAIDNATIVQEVKEEETQKVLPEQTVTQMPVEQISEEKQPEVEDAIPAVDEEVAAKDSPNEADGAAISLSEAPDGTLDPDFFDIDLNSDEEDDDDSESELSDDTTQLVAISEVKEDLPVQQTEIVYPVEKKEDTKVADIFEDMDKDAMEYAEEHPQSIVRPMYDSLKASPNTITEEISEQEPIAAESIIENTEETVPDSVTDIQYEDTSEDEEDIFGGIDLDEPEPLAQSVPQVDDTVIEEDEEQDNIDMDIVEDNEQSDETPEEEENIPKEAVKVVEKQAPVETLARPRRGQPYSVPVEGLLTMYEDTPYWIIDDETKANSVQLKDTLREFKIEADVVGIRKGPVITMFELLPAPGVKLSKIVALQDNIALRLAASSVRIVAPIPGKRAVGIEVPNRDRAIVSFREIISQDLPAFKKMAVPVILGKDIQGEPQIIDLVKTPHLLIAGATGAGKSVCVNSMILSILYKRSPQEVKLILIDPKIVELKLYNDIPHLLTPVITEPKKAFQAMQYCLSEMERRYAMLDGMGVRDISSYNKRIVERHMAAEKLPYMVVIIDEFADLMATTGKEMESTIARLAAMSRAVGIHIVLATQRPSIDVITGLIKANIPSRIAFMVASKTDSRIIIDQVGAEKLLGRGDMLYASATDPFPIRIQGTFISDNDVESVVDYVKTTGEPEYIDDEIFVSAEDEEDQLDLFGSEGEDPLYDKALDIVIQAGKASASYIQRRLKIGYNRAARLVEEMEERGIVGPANGSKPREIIHVP